MGDSSGGLEQPIRATVRDGHGLEPVRRPRAQLVERLHLMVSVREFVEVNQGPRAQIRFSPAKDRGSTRVEVTIHVQDKLVVVWDCEFRQGFLKPSDLERYTAVIDLR